MTLSRIDFTSYSKNSFVKYLFSTKFGHFSTFLFNGARRKSVILSIFFRFTTYWFGSCINQGHFTKP